MKTIPTYKGFDKPRKFFEALLSFGMVHLTAKWKGKYMNNVYYHLPSLVWQKICRIKDKSRKKILMFLRIQNQIQDVKYMKH